jgi:hypothetical protein
VVPLLPEQLWVVHRPGGRGSDAESVLVTASGLFGYELAAFGIVALVAALSVLLSLRWRIVGVFGVVAAIVVGVFHASAIGMSGLRAAGFLDLDDDWIGIASLLMIFVVGALCVPVARAAQHIALRRARHR